MGTKCLRRRVSPLDPFGWGSGWTGNRVQGPLQHQPYLCRKRTWGQCPLLRLALLGVLLLLTYTALREVRPVFDWLALLFLRFGISPEIPGLAFLALALYVFYRVLRWAR
jgi:hypothetical protein